MSVFLTLTYYSDTRCVCWGSGAGGVGSILHQAIYQWLKLADLQSNNSNTICLELADPKSQDITVPWDCTHPSTHTHFKGQWQCSLDLGPIGYKSKVPMTFSSGSIDLLEQLPELRKTVGSLFINLLLKDMIKGTDEHLVGKMWRARYMFVLYWCATLLPASLCVHGPGSSLNSMLLGFLWRFLPMGMMVH